ncbi:MAG: metallophosphoesterase [Clostridia bacterium]|nr:metallophosphoesterase [Clostridia bacterium]
MKFSIFSDLHCCSGVYLCDDDTRLTLIQKRAEEENVDFIIHAGDFCSKPDGENAAAYLKKYNEFHIPSYHCLGNHDTDGTSYEETLKLYNMPDDHYYFDCKGFRIVICNPNYFLLDGEYVHYNLRNYFRHNELRDYMPPEQLAWLRETIESSPYPCVIISHESFERGSGGVKNMLEVQKIINDANRKKPHSVILCINGHHHRDHIRILDNVVYFELNSASLSYLNKVHTLYPEELCREYRGTNHTAIYNDPLHAVITLDEKPEGVAIVIDGMESEMFLGVTVEMTGNEQYDNCGHPAEPRVQSAKIMLMN